MSIAPGPPDPRGLSDAMVERLAVRVLITIAAIVAAVWAVDSRFITRAEFNMVAGQVKYITQRVDGIGDRLGVKPPVKPLEPGAVDP